MTSSTSTSSSRSSALGLTGLSAVVLAAVGSQLLRTDSNPERSAPPAQAVLGANDNRDAKSPNYRDVVDSVIVRFHGRTAPYVDTLIVMVADPIDTGLDWAYDQHVKAVRRAYEAAGFTLVYHNVPWQPDPKGPTQSRKSPGFLVFNNQTEKRIAPVFLIAESPTAGLTADAADALQTALDQEHLLTCPPDKRRVVGPIFSGTRHALVHGLRQGAIRHDFVQRQTKLVNGSATAASLLMDLRDSAANLDPPLDLVASSVLMHDGDYEKSIKQLSERLGYKPHECAIVSESSTQYGQALLGDKKKFYDQCWKISFPSHVTHLRVEYLARWQQEKPHGAMPETIGLGLLDSSNAALAPEPVSSLTDAVVDQRLTGTLQRLRASGAKMAILLATDVRDKILLGREIARQVPDVQLVTTEANLLYLRSEIAIAQRGMIVVGSAALVPGLEERDVTGSTFASDAEVGVCAAVLEHLGEWRCLSPQNPPGIEHMRKKAGIESMLGKRVCVTCVGSTQMLPVYWDTKETFIGRDRDHETSPADWRVAAGVATMALIVALACFRILRYGRASIQHHKRAGDSISLRSALHTRVWCVVFGFCSLGLQMAAMGFSLSCIPAFRLDIVTVGCWVLVVVLTCVAVISACCLALALWSLLKDLWSLRRLPSRERLSLESWRCAGSWFCDGFGPASVVILAVLLMLTGIYAACLDSSWYSERVRLVFEFVSPIVPTLALGSMIAYWVAGQMRRAIRCRQPLPYEYAMSRDSECRQPIAARQILLGKGIGHPVQSMGIAGIALLILYSLREHTTIEVLARSQLDMLRDPFGAFFRFGFLTLMAAVIIGCARIVGVWSVLARHVSRFDEPIRAAMRRKAEQPEPPIEIDLAARPLRKNRPFEMEQAWNGVAQWNRDQMFTDDRIAEHVQRAPSPAGRRALLETLGRLHGDHSSPSHIDRVATVAPAVADYVATEFCVWLRWVLGQLQRMAKNLMLLVIASSLVLWVYPLHPQTTQTTAYLAASLTLIGTLLYLVIAMSANPVLSVLTKTDPGHVTFNRAFVNSFLVYVALPGLAFVAAQMPEFGAQLLGWVQPLLSAAATR